MTGESLGKKLSNPAARPADTWGERRYSFYTFFTSGQRHAPAALYPRRKEPRYSFYRRLGGTQSRSGHIG
jgi:hypothetical protein